MTLPTHQIFKYPIPFTLISDFFEVIGTKLDRYNCYNISIVTYKRAIWMNLLVPFFVDCAHYYHGSKAFYVNTDDITYKNFITVLRQICRYNKIVFLTDMKRGQSTYILEYVIQVSEGNVTPSPSEP